MKTLYFCVMIFNSDTAKELATSLLQINAIILQPNNPFTWASGWKSPIYCDNRKTLSYPKIRVYIRQKIAEIVSRHYEGANIIAGVATGGIAHGALVAEELNSPFIYIRSKKKGHGRGNQIEGFFNKGDSVIVIEDLISTGKSSLEAVKALRDAGLVVKGLVSIFTYGFQYANENFKEMECNQMSLCDYDTLLEKALENHYINDSDLLLLKDWKLAPDKWGK